MDSFFQDLRYAARGLVRASGFTAVSIITLALGIASTTVIFTLMNAFLLRPLPVHEPDRLVTVEEIRRGGRSTQQMGQEATPYQRYRDIRAATGSVFSGLAAQRQNNHSVRIDGPARMVPGVIASDNYFDVLGVRPAMGRLFSGDDATAPVAVVSHRLWRDQLGGDPRAIGRTLHLDGRPMEVIGVAPPGFGGTLVGLVAEVWAPLEGYEAATPEGATTSRPWVLTFARLQPGVELGQAVAALETVARQLPAEDPAREFVDVRLRQLSGVPASLRTPLLGFMGMLMATAGLLLATRSGKVP
ncbi:MAG: ABC transporter permease [Candidatus Krumholzibacteriia bacterium]